MAKKPAVICAVTAIAIAGISFIVWIAYFFSVPYSEISQGSSGVSRAYVPTECDIIAKSENSRTCCEVKCYKCTSCGDKESSCYDLLYSSLAIPGYQTSCCGGYHCCEECCSTCEKCENKCTNGVCKEECSKYSCNCRCCNTIFKTGCKLACSSCYKPIVSVRYREVDVETGFFTGRFVSSSVTKDCSKDYNCVTSFLDRFAGNETYTCYYNPIDVKEVTFANQVTPWKFAILGLLSIIPGGMILLILAALLLGAVMIFYFFASGGKLHIFGLIKRRRPANMEGDGELGGIPMEGGQELSSFTNLTGLQGGVDETGSSLTFSTGGDVQQPANDGLLSIFSFKPQDLTTLLTRAQAGLCVNCRENRMQTHVVMPCRHKCICKACASSRLQYCPLCGTRCTSVEAVH